MFNVPEIGQVVAVRQRRFVISEKKLSHFESNTLATDKGDKTHLLNLVSIEDDALGEELQIIWELEPGTEIIEKDQLPVPDGFDKPERLDAFLNAVKWGVVSSADIQSLQSPFRSGIEIEDYQLDPVVRALNMPRVNLLIADDVGLGKTIEAGLVIQEMILRNRIRSVLVVCPSWLQVHWKDQMREKFGLEFRIVDSNLMKYLRRKRGWHVNPWNHFPRLITSIDYMKRDRPFSLFQELLPAKGQPNYPRKFDLLIIDEAHNIAPSAGGNYAIDSMRTSAIRNLSPHFEHKLFLTATPHNGYRESFTALLELLDNQRFARGIEPNREQLKAIMVRRLKSELPSNWDGSPRFPKRRIVSLEVDYTEEEKGIHQKLHRYSELRKLKAETGAEKFALEFVLKILKKRLFSSPAAFATTLEKHLSTLKKQRMQATFKTPAISEKALKLYLERLDEESADDEIYESGIVEAVETAAKYLTGFTDEEQGILENLLKYIIDVQFKRDTKVDILVRWLKSIVWTNGQWNNERVLIFTEYRTTQKWLYQILASEGFAKDERLLKLYGGMDDKTRERIKAAFQANPEESKVRILLATDAASEGIDLQNHCHRLVHYEIPWNPNRMEQRNGRLDRHGQKAKEVLCHHFVPKGFQDGFDISIQKPGELTGDLEFLMRAVLKVEKMRVDLGEVGPVIASQVEEVMLGSRFSIDTRKAEIKARESKRVLRFERDLRDQIKKLYDKLEASQKDLKITPENLKQAIEIALEISGQPSLVPTELNGVWPDPSGKRKSCPIFKLPPMRGSWAFCRDGLNHPHTGKVRPITFDHNIAKGRDDIVLVHLNHRLAQMALRLLRAEIWATEHTKKLNRIAVKTIPDHLLSYPAVIAHGRLVVLGSDQQRLHEELITAGGTIEQGKFKRISTVRQVDELLGIQGNTDAPEEIKIKFKNLWNTLKEQLYQALEARMNERTRNLEKFIAERAQKDIDDITSVLKDLEQTIREELRTETVEQLELWTDDERDQLERNRESLVLRLRQIPEEIEKEKGNILRRYADPSPRLFPVAVTFYVPERLATGSRGLL